MIKKTIYLGHGATDIQIQSATDDKTVILYNLPIWPNKACFYVVSGKWSIQSIFGNSVILVNQNEIINDHDNANSGKSI